MNNTHLESILEKLNNELESNNKRITELEELIYLYRQNINDNDKLARTVILTAFASMPITLVTYLLLKHGIATFTLMQILFPVSSCAIGIGCDYLLKKKNDTKKLFKNYSSAKTDDEKIVEQTKYEVELERLKNKNKVLKKVISDIEGSKKILPSIMNKYNITINKNDESREQLTAKINDLDNKLKESENKLNKISLKSVLVKKFTKIRCKTNLIIDPLINASITFILSLLWFGLLPITCARSVSQTINGSLLLSTLPSIILMPTAIFFTIKETKNFKKAFKNINKKLGEDKLTEYENDYEYDLLENEKKDLINKNYNLKLQLENEKQNLIELNNKEDENSYNKEYMLDETLEDEIINSEPLEIDKQRTRSKH